MYCQLMIIVKISGSVQIVRGEKLKAITVRPWVTQPSDTQFWIESQNFKVHTVLCMK